MEWLYLPKPQHHAKRFRKRKVSRLHFRRQIRRRQTLKLSKSVVGLFLIVLMLRLGTTIGFTMHDSLGFWAFVYSDGIRPPQSQKRGDFKSPRLYRIVTITRKGTIKIEGQLLAQNEWDNSFTRFRQQQPKVRILFVVDRDAPMRSVHAVLNALRKNRIYGVYFVTSERGDEIY